MPVRNEGAFMARSLDAVLAQDYPADRLEILVADGCSTDGTRGIVHARQTQPHNLHLIDNLGRIAPTGLNAALRLARGEIIVRVDGHCEIAPDYVRRCVEQLHASGADGVGGPIETIGETSMARTIAAAMTTSFGVGGTAFRTGRDRPEFVDTIAFPAYTRSVVERAGPFDEELVRNQDDEYNYRLRGLGARLLLTPDINARYYSRSSLLALWRQYFQYGFWKVRVLQKHPRQMQPRQFVPPAFVAALFVSAVLGIFVPVGRCLFLAVTCGYLGANLIASVWTARQKGWRHLPRLPMIFATLHVSYGLGFLVGLVKFWDRWDDRVGNTRRVPASNAADS